jgi:hypothetical protein
MNPQWLVYTSTVLVVAPTRGVEGWIVSQKRADCSLDFGSLEVLSIPDRVSTAMFPGETSAGTRFLPEIKSVGSDTLVTPVLVPSCCATTPNRS